MGLVVLALGTVPVTTGVVEVLNLFALRTVIDVSPQDRRTATLDGVHDLMVAGWHPGAKASTILGTVMVKDGGHFYHGRSSAIWPIAATATSSDLQVRWVPFVLRPKD
jgi:hypothetical protein